MIAKKLVLNFKIFAEEVKGIKKDIVKELIVEELYRLQNQKRMFL